MEILKDEKIIERILNKAVEEILPSKDFLKEKLLSGQRLKIYQGFDPTAPTLHIGHTVMMRKLEDFRKLGHEVIFLIGDFTARVGDPTDKTSARQKLSEKQIQENLKLYKEQAQAIIDIENKENPVSVLFNSTWLSKLNFGDILELSSEFTVQQMIKRSMFQKRLEEDKPIHLNEFMYPLMQGYDSVAMGVDVEVGGNDQLFNMLAGRDLVMSHLKKEKIVIAGKLLTTSEGAKMGKSEGNMIMLSDQAEDIFGKVMAFPDEHIVPGFELLTDLGLEEVNTISTQFKENDNPMELKKKLAYEVTNAIKGKEKAREAQQHFESVFQKRDFNTELEEIEGVGKPIIEVLTISGIADSKSSARRLIDQNAVKLNEQVITDWQSVLKEEGVLKVGKKVFKIR